MKFWPRSSLWVQFARTKIFICALKRPIAKSPLVTPSILPSVELTPMTLLCSDGSNSMSGWICVINVSPMRVIWDPVSISICMLLPLRVPFREKSCSMGVVISPSGRVAAFARGG